MTFNTSKLRFELIQPHHKAQILCWLDEPHVREFYYGDGLANTIKNIELFCNGVNNNGHYTFFHWIAYSHSRV